MGKWCVYKHTFPSGKVYYGITSRAPEERWSDGFGYSGKKKMFREIVEVGWSNIRHEILHNGLSEREARAIERGLIQNRAGETYNLKCNRRWEKEKGAERVARGQYKEKTFWTINGVTKPVLEWCTEYGKGLGGVKKRMEKHGLSPLEALTFPPVPRTHARHAKKYWREQGCDV